VVQHVDEVVHFVYLLELELQSVSVRRHQGLVVLE